MQNSSYCKNGIKRVLITITSSKIQIFWNNNYNNNYNSDNGDIYNNMTSSLQKTASLNIYAWESFDRRKFLRARIIVYPNCKYWGFIFSPHLMYMYYVDVYNLYRYNYFSNNDIPLKGILSLTFLVTAARIIYIKRKRESH